MQFNSLKGATGPGLNSLSQRGRRHGTTKDVVSSDFLLVQPMPGCMQTVLVSGKKLPDGSFHRKKGYIVWLKKSGEEWLQDSHSVEIGA